MNKLKINKQNIYILDSGLAQSHAYDLIYSNNEAKNIIKDLQITDKELEKNYELLLNLIDQNKCCDNCKGVKDCKKINKGTKYNIRRSNDGSLVETYTYCKYYQTYAILEENLIYSTYKKSEILLQKNNFIEENILEIHLKHNQIITFIKNFKENNLTNFYLFSEDSKFRKKVFYALLSKHLLKKHQCCIIKIGSFLKELKDSFRDKEHYEEILNYVLNTKVLIIDDLGGEVISSWSRDDILSTILSYRFEKELPTIFGSDYKLEELKLLYSLGNDNIKVTKFVNKIKQFIEI